jgi:hypothetical protein
LILPRKGGGRVSRDNQRPRGAKLVALLAGAWLLFLLIPLPPPLIGWLAPGTYELFQASLPGWPLTSGYDPLADQTATGLLATWRPLSLSPFLAWSATLRLAAYCAAFLLIVRYPWANPRGMAFGVTRLLVFLGAIEAVYALWQSSMAQGMIYWYRRPPGGGIASGTYVNRNHFAGLVEMILPLAVGMAMASGYRLYRPMRASQRGGAPRLRELIPLVSARNIFGLATYVSVALLLVVALYLSLSRAGFIGPLAAACLLAPFLPSPSRQQIRNSEFGVRNPQSAPSTSHPARRTSHSTPAIPHSALRIPHWLISPALAVVGAVLFLLSIDLPELAPRFTAGQIAEGGTGRQLAVFDSLRMIGAFPIFGIGLGNFELTYPAYRSVGGGHVRHVHNDFAQLAVEAGVPALALAVLLLVALYRRALRALRETKGEARYLLWGALVGVTALLLHSFTDFNLQIPANALIFSVLLGLVVLLSSGRRVPSPLAGEGQDGGSTYFVGSPLAPALVLAVLLFLAMWCIPTAKAEARFRRIFPDSRLVDTFEAPQQQQEVESLPALEELASEAPRHPFIRYALGLELLRRGTHGACEPSERLEKSANLQSANLPIVNQRANLPTCEALLEEAGIHFAAAASAVPQWARPHLQLGILGLAGAPGLQRPDAEAALARAQALDPYNQRLTRTIARVRRVATYGQ